MKGDPLEQISTARLEVLFLGEGVRGIRPPAVFDEKIPRWVLTGVDTAAVAIEMTISDNSKEDARGNHARPLFNRGADLDNL